MQTRWLTIILITVIGGAVWYTHRGGQIRESNKPTAQIAPDFPLPFERWENEIEQVDGRELIAGVRWLDEKSFVKEMIAVQRSDNGAPYYHREMRPVRDKWNVLRRHHCDWWLVPEWRGIFHVTDEDVRRVEDEKRAENRIDDPENQVP